MSGEKRSELLVVPALSVRVSPEVAIMPAGGSDTSAACCVGGSSPRRRAAAARGAAAGRGRGRGAAGRGTEPPPPPPPAVLTREIRVTVVNDTKGAAESRRQARRCRRAGRPRLRSRRLTFTREDESQTDEFRRAIDAVDAERRIRGRCRATVGRGGVHARLPGDRVPAHPPAAHLSRGGARRSR